MNLCMVDGRGQHQQRPLWGLSVWFAALSCVIPDREERFAGNVFEVSFSRMNCNRSVFICFGFFLFPPKACNYACISLIDQRVFCFQELFMQSGQQKKENVWKKQEFSGQGTWPMKCITEMYHWSHCSRGGWKHTHTKKKEVERSMWSHWQKWFVYDGWQPFWREVNGGQDKNAEVDWAVTGAVLSSRTRKLNM